MCDTTCTKYLVFTFNLIFWLIGLFLIAIGVWAKVDDDFLKTVMQISGEHEEVAERISIYVGYMALFVIALGAVISIIALFGCCGAIRQSRCCLGVFFVLMLLCFLVTVVFGGFILFVAATGKSDDDVSRVIRESFQEMVRIMWQAMTDEERTNFEKANQCCGIDATLDSIASNPKCAISLVTTTENCSSKLIEKVQDKFFLSGGIIMGIAVIEIVGMTMACILFNRYQTVYTAV